MPLKLVTRPGTNFWYIRGTIGGRRITESTGTDNKKLAEQIRVKREAELFERKLYGDKHTRTFAQAALSYIEMGGETTYLNPIIAHFGKTRLAEIGQLAVDTCAVKLKKNAAPGTRNRHIYTPIIAVLSHAARNGWCERPLIERPKQPRGRVRWVKPDVADRMINNAAKHLRPLMIFLFSQGCRLSEALYLNWDEVDLDRAHVVFLDTKNGENRGCPIQPRALAALKALKHRTGAVFRTDEGKPYARRKMGGGGQLSSAWATMLEKSDVADFHPHDCRHTWATWHYIKNRDLATLMQLGGWKTVTMVMRYTHANVEHLAPSIADLWENGTSEVQAKTGTDSAD